VIGKALGQLDEENRRRLAIGFTRGILAAEGCIRSPTGSTVPAGLMVV
jgi:hypothetical protein